MKSYQLILCILLLTSNSVLFAQNFPFPQQKVYSYGLKPNSSSQEVMNEDVQAKFVKWRSVFLTSQGCLTANTKRIDAVNNNHETYSEGTSYGMMILVYMDNSTNLTRSDFDAVFGYYKSYLNDKGLMKWKISSAGVPSDNSFAGDGDELVAFSLLMADRQWGSNGKFNYLEEAKTIIGNLVKYNVQPDYTFADGDGGWIFPAYQMPYAMKEFGKVTNNTKGWNSTIDRAFTLLDIFYKNSTSLMCDTHNSNGEAVNASHSYYGYDACRVPWHLGLDYLWNGTTNSQLAKNHPAKIAGWAKSKWNGNPANAKQKYKLDGTEAANYCDFGTMVGPMMVGAMTTNDQDWINTLYEFCRNLSVGTNYFADHLLMLNLLVATGNIPNFRDMTIPTGVDKISINTKEDMNTKVVVFPNPTNGKDLTINLTDFKTSAESVIKIYNLQGKLQYVFASSENEFTIPDPGIAKGLYLLQVNNQKNEVCKKVIVN